MVGLTSGNVLQSKSQSSGVLGVHAYGLAGDQRIDAHDVCASVTVEVARHCHIAKARVDLCGTENRSGCVIEDARICRAKVE